MADVAVAAESNPQQKIGLRRGVTTRGSYTWGYADIGADIYAALGLVIVDTVPMSAEALTLVA
jgi:hypothetical protein